MKNTALLIISIVIFCVSASSANLFGQSAAETYVNNDIIVKLAHPPHLPGTPLTGKVRWEVTQPP